MPNKMNMDVESAKAALIERGWSLDPRSPSFNCQWRSLEDPSVRTAYEQFKAQGPVLKTNYELTAQKWYPRIGLFLLMSGLNNLGMMPTHLTQHAIGRYAIEHADRTVCRHDQTNVSAALAVASLTPLWGGLVHGVLLGGMDALGTASQARLWRWAQSSSVCNRALVASGQFVAAVGGLDSTMKTFGSCVHGIGHGIMMNHGRKLGGGAFGVLPTATGTGWLQTALDSSLGSCDGAFNAAEQCQCATGVYMQYQMDASRVHAKDNRREGCLDRRYLRYNSACWDRYWTGQRPASNQASLVRGGACSADVGRTVYYNGTVGYDACAGPDIKPGSYVHAACIFGYSKTKWLNWAGRKGANENFLFDEPCKLPAFPGRTFHSALEAYCAAYQPITSMAWRACVFAAVYDLAREKRLGVAILSEQRRVAEREGVSFSSPKQNWTHFKKKCATYLPARSSDVLQLCLEGFLSHATLEHYSPCGHVVLGPAPTV